MIDDFHKLLNEIKSARGLKLSEHFDGATYIGETYVTQTRIFGWVLTHPARPNPDKERGISAIYGNKKQGTEPHTFPITPLQLLQLREALTLNADYYDTQVGNA